MMIHQFAVRDSKSQTFGNPFYFPTVNVALRSLADEVNSKSGESMINLHPEDFELFHLGEFDPSTGLSVCYPAPKPVVIASALVKSNGG